MSDNVLTEETGEELEEYEYDEPEAEETELEEPEERVFTDDEGTQYSEGELREIIKNFKNDKKWKDKNRQRGEQLNKQSKGFHEYKERQLERIKKTEERARKLLQKGMFQQGAQQQATEAEYKHREGEFLITCAAMMREFPDFDMNTLSEFTKGFGIKFDTVSSPDDMARFIYFAWKGSQVEDLIREAKAEMVRESKSKKGLPATSGSVEYQGLPETMEDAKKASRWAILRK